MDMHWRTTGAKGSKEKRDGKLRHEHDWGPPKCCFLSSRVQYGYLKSVVAWRKLVESNGEVDRHRLQAVIQSIFNLQRLCFQCFRLCVVETHKGDDRLNAWGTLLVGLQVNIHVSALAEDASHAGNQFLTILD